MSQFKETSYYYKQEIEFNYRKFLLKQEPDYTEIKYVVSLNFVICEQKE